MQNNRRTKVGPLHIFLSYSTKDKKFAGELKTSLEKYGMKLFLAHDDISPTLKWQEVILKNLRSCDIVIPIFTKNFHESLWTDQECGIALGLKKVILPLRCDLDPYGFIAHFQGQQGKGLNIEKLREEILRTLSTIKKLKGRFSKMILSQFAASENFFQSINLSKAILIIDRFSARDLNSLLRIAIANNQIHNCVIASGHLNRIMSANETRVNSLLLKKFRILTGRKSYVY
ncbi:MAG: toll/interleukin-1 receptor domain-containing protein [Melioribacteraceae bacterium]